MAHYAKVLDGVVVDVIVAEPTFFDTFVDTSPGVWVETSYNMVGGVYIDRATNLPAEDQSVIEGDAARQRKNYAVVGGTYDGVGFARAQPYPSWTLNTDTYLWQAPVPAPEAPSAWDEENQQWVEV